jgi:hypothetical protein
MFFHKSMASLHKRLLPDTPVYAGHIHSNCRVTPPGCQFCVRRVVRVSDKRMLVGSLDLCSRLFRRDTEIIPI